MLIRSGFNAALDTAFYLNANPDPDPGSQTNADLDLGHTLKFQKVEFLHENILKAGNRSKNIRKKVQEKYIESR